METGSSIACLAFAETSLAGVVEPLLEARVLKFHHSIIEFLDVKYQIAALQKYFSIQEIKFHIAVKNS
jgi:hypothetical protein